MFDVKFVFLYTDAVLWVLLAVVVFYAWRAARMPLAARKWRRVLANKTALAAAAVLSVFFVIALSRQRALSPGAARGDRPADGLRDADRLAS